VKIEFRDVSFGYQGQNGPQIMADLNLEVPSGQMLGIIGPSGCGKTSLLRMVAGLQTPTKGEILFSNPDAVGLPKSFMAFQDSGLFPWLSVLENACIGLEAQGVSKAVREGQVQDMLKRIGLDQVADKKPHELSGRMRQRIALVRLLVSGGDILLLDEPLSAVDAQTGRFLQQELLDLWSVEPKTTIYVTHDIEEALTLSDRVVVLSRNQGRILADITVPTPRPLIATARPTPDIERLRWEIWALLAESHPTKDGPQNA
jgi:NitT/TauT family transport system ATP-binding protein